MKVAQRGDFQLCSNTVGTGHQNRVVVISPKEGIIEIKPKQASKTSVQLHHTS
jgi:hypothetical protein